MMQKGWTNRLVIRAISITLVIGFLILEGCTPPPPQNTQDACAIFNEYPRWYWASLDSYRRWGIPVSVQLAIMRQESHFVGNAAPPRTTLFGFIPWKRPTTAYGYAQALNGTWRHYIVATGNTGADRDNFADASDFIGWYGYQAHQQLGISRNNAYELYLAYHEGIGGYKNKTFEQKPWLIGVARKVQSWANVYRNQIGRCKYQIAKPSFANMMIWKRLHI